MCVKFQLSISDCAKDIKGIVLSAGSVNLQKRAWHIWPTLCPKKRPPFYFSNNSVKNQSIVMIFGVLNPEKIWHQ